MLDHPPHRLPLPATLAAFTVMVAAAVLGGCTATPDPTTLPMYAGTSETADRLAWNDLVERAIDAEVVVIGEEHDDAVTHALQATLVADVMALDPRTAVSLEMLERHEQGIVDAWLADEIATADLVERTGSRSWFDWAGFYQPVLDAAKSADCVVVAANAPRQYVSRARTEGYDALRALPEDERVLFDLPENLDQGRYWLRFRDTMRGFRGDDASDEEIRRTFRSQLVWDATMAASIANALDRDDVDRVIHLVGRFHSDHEGGTIRELRRLRPDVRILTITGVGEGDGLELLEDDRGRADVVVYTGSKMGE